MTLVIYHANCVDGMTAAWIAYRSLPEGTARLHAAGYGEPLPMPDKDEEVLFVDFCPPINVLRSFATLSRAVTILDHHKTANEMLRGNALPARVKRVIDMTRSGALIAWDFFRPAFEERNPLASLDSVDWIVQRVSDRDLWKFEHPETADVFASMSATPYTIEAWDRLMATIPDMIVHDGKAIQRYRTKLIESCAENVQWAAIAGHVAPVVNAPYEVGSDVAALLLDRYPGAPFAGYYLDKPDVRQWGLRSRDDRADVEVIAATFGGGGHRNASGFKAKPEEIRLS